MCQRWYLDVLFVVTHAYVWVYVWEVYHYSCEHRVKDLYCFTRVVLVSVIRIR